MAKRVSRTKDASPTKDMAAARKPFNEWFRCHLRGYSGSTLEASDRHRKSNLRDAEVAKHYESLVKKMCAPHRPVTEAMIRSYGKATMPPRIPEAFLEVFGFLRNRETLESKKAIEEFRRYLELSSEELNDRIEAVIGAADQTKKIRSSRVIQLCIGLYRGQWRGETLQSFYAGVIKEARKRSVFVVSETGTERPMMDDGIKALKRLADLGANSFIVSHWPENVSQPTDWGQIFDKRRYSAGSRPPMVSYESPGFGPLGAVNLMQDHDRIVASLIELAKKEINRLRAPKGNVPARILVLNDPTTFDPLISRNNSWIKHSKELLGLVDVHFAKCDSKVGPNFDAHNREVVAKALTSHLPNIVICMWEEFARVCMDGLRGQGVHNRPAVFTVDLPRRFFEEIENRNSALKGAVFVDPFAAGRTCVEMLVAKWDRIGNGQQQSESSVEGSKFLSPHTATAHDVVPYRGDYLKFLKSLKKPKAS